MNILIINIVLIFAFSIVFILNLYGVNKENKKLRIVVKPLIMPLIAGFYCVNTGKVDFLVIAALTGGWLGDIFLLSDSTKGFIAGLLSFLAGHIVYIAVFVLEADSFNTVGKNYYFALIPAVLLWLAGIFILKKKAGKLFVPSVVYFLVLIAMVFTSGACFYTSDSLRVAAPVLAGAVFFLASDSLLGLRKFTGLIKKNSILVMLTYMVAQALIAGGLAFA
jgi:uncharacterized membrane protein YhhN